MKKIIGLLLVVIMLAVFPVACGVRPASPLEGIWENQEGDSITFSRNNFASANGAGTFEWLEDEGRIEFTFHATAEHGEFTARNRIELEDNWMWLDGELFERLR